MPITREKKETIITDLKKLFEKASILVFVNFHGLSVVKERKLRLRFREADVKYKVVKKTLLMRALDASGFSDVPKLEGEIGIVAGYSEVTEPPAIIANFIKEQKEGLAIIGGIFETKYVDASVIKQLASIPSREVLLTQLAFILTHPVASFARVLLEVNKKQK